MITKTVFNPIFLHFLTLWAETKSNVRFRRVNTPLYKTFGLPYLFENYNMFRYLSCSDSVYKAPLNFLVNYSAKLAPFLLKRKFNFFFNNLKFLRKKRRKIFRTLKLKKFKKINFFFLKKNKAQTVLNLKSRILFLILSKKLTSFWPLRVNYKRLLLRQYNFSKKKKLKRIRSLSTFSSSIIKGAWSFFGSLKSPRSKFHRSHDFSKKTILIFWKSQEFFKTYHQPKRHWTTRKFFYKFSDWFKKNKKAGYMIAPLLWELLVSSGLSLSKYESSIISRYHLIFSLSNTAPEACVPKKGGSIFTVSPLLLSMFSPRRSFYFFLKKRFGRFQRTQYLNRLSQWRSISKKKPKYINSILFRKTFSNKYWYFDPLSLSFLVNHSAGSALRTNPRYLSLNPRHNLERLNLFKLKL